MMVLLRLNFLVRDRLNMYLVVMLMNLTVHSSYDFLMLSWFNFLVCNSWPCLLLDINRMFISVMSVPQAADVAFLVSRIYISLMDLAEILDRRHDETCVICI